MPRKNEGAWMLKRVRRKNAPAGPVGQVIDSTSLNGWWMVEWPDGKKTMESQRLLVVVPESEAPRL